MDLTSLDPMLIREETFSFDAAVHQQTIPEIQTLNYFTACLIGDALLAVRGYDIVPENYELIRELLTILYYKEVAPANGKHRKDSWPPKGQLGATAEILEQSGAPRDPST
ncbi:unnamed protein product [Litomosoides sigmodontis]|uniref:Uncharacterized protein n=1 Tax=Litomosoides sigmodontis TaxID=42156 RepID=A0A3P6SYQ1_LITSI|nr:unnamed protein product [Litomosoides sigmodontis]